jgi:glycosyltransferase involved in cell wall biosynthesis
MAISNNNELSKTTPLVTIVITVFKRVEFLREALESVLVQTFESYEIIVSDDGNSAAAKAICESVDQGGKIRYRFNQQRLGVALNVRAAIAEAKGKYIAILNDDDYWEPEFLSRLVAPLERDARRVLAFSDHWVMLGNGTIDVEQTARNTKTFKRDALPEGELRDTAKIVLNKTVPLVQAAVFRKDALNVARLVTNVAGAYDFWMSCLLATMDRPFYYVAERLTRYRTHQQMETLRPSADKFEPEVFIYRSLLEENYFPKWRKFIEQELAYMLYRCGRARLEFNDLPKARQLFNESIRLSPSWKTFLRLIVTYFPKQIRLSLSFTQPVD